MQQIDCWVTELQTTIYDDPEEDRRIVMLIKEQIMTNGIKGAGDRSFIMIDCETMGLKSSAPVLSIGAVAYNLTFGVFKRFEAFIELQEQFDSGRKPEQDAFFWWLQQSESARRDVASRDRMTVAESLAEFCRFYADVQCSLELDDPTELYMSANGNDFDLPVLESMWGSAPWHYKKKIDFRTLGILYIDELEWPTSEAQHTALNDAENQALVHLKLLSKYPDFLSRIKRAPAK